MHYSPGLQLDRKTGLAQSLLSSENVRRFLLLFVVLVSTIVVQTISAANRERVQRPNVILVVAEEFGYGDLGVNGQKHFKTPRLDQFANDGLRFTNYYAGGSLGVVSRGTMLTGKHTGHARVRGDRDLALASLDTTLGELAKQAGYHTGAIGKWGLGGPGSSGIPTVKGFDEWFGYLDEASATNHYPVTLWRNQTNLFWDKNSNGQREEYAPYLFTKAATNFVTLNHRRPFFLYLAYPLPAAPLQSPTDKPYKAKDWPKAQKTLAAMIYRLDRDIGKIVDTLKHHEIDENTVVIFTSAAGPHADEGINPDFFNSTGGHRGKKGDLYEGGIRVPMLVRWPGQIKAGRTSDHLCASWDLYPTIAHLMGLSDFDSGDGISLTPTFLGRRQTRHPFLYWERHGSDGFAQAIRSGDWKAVRVGQSPALELYHLGRDPGEKKDVSARYRRTSRRMERYFTDARTPSKDWPSPIDEAK
jgi:arylsulfatase A-like enzyme